jgi:hypothetical protein
MYIYTREVTFPRLVKLVCPSPGYAPSRGTNCITYTEYPPCDYHIWVNQSLNTWYVTPEAGESSVPANNSRAMVEAPTCVMLLLGCFDAPEQPGTKTNISSWWPKKHELIDDKTINPPNPAVNPPSPASAVNPPLPWTHLPPLRTHPHTHIHTNINKHTHTHMQIHRHAHVHTFTHTHTCMPTHTNTHANMYMCELASVWWQGKHCRHEVTMSSCQWFSKTHTAAHKS